MITPESRLQLGVNVLHRCVEDHEADHTAETAAVRARFVAASRTCPSTFMFRRRTQPDGARRRRDLAEERSDRDSGGAAPGRDGAAPQSRSDAAAVWPRRRSRSRRRKRFPISSCRPSPAASSCPSTNAACSESRPEFSVKPSQLLHRGVDDLRLLGQPGHRPRRTVDGESVQRRPPRSPSPLSGSRRSPRRASRSPDESPSKDGSNSSSARSVL